MIARAAHSPEHSSSWSADVVGGGGSCDNSAPCSSIQSSTSSGTDSTDELALVRVRVGRDAERERVGSVRMPVGSSSSSAAAAASPPDPRSRLPDEPHVPRSMLSRVDAR